MFYWAWGILKRRPARNLMLGGLLTMSAVAIHLKLLGHPGDHSIQTGDMSIIFVFSDALVALAAVAILACGMWRLAHGRP